MLLVASTMENAPGALADRVEGIAWSVTAAGDYGEWHF
jgi:hypothetical protein